MTPTPFKIADRWIGDGHPPFVIAEMSGNHGQSLERALQIVDAAAASGVDAVKLQTYTADTMTLDLAEGPFLIDDPDSLWSGRTLYDLYDEAHTPWDWHAQIFDHCKALGLICFSTPFDFTAVEFLETLGVPAYKIASFENTDLPLLRAIVATGKPVIMSTGMTTPDELDESVTCLREAGCRDLVLLKCTSAYPAPPEAANLRAIPAIRERYGLHVGLSDHTMGIGVALGSVAFGAVVIEKHFVRSRADGGIDSAFSMDQSEMTALVRESKTIYRALGHGGLTPDLVEKPSLAYRRSLYITVDLRAGDRLTRDNVRAIRPGFGLATKHIDEVLDEVVTCDVRRGTPMSWALLGR